MTRLWHLPILCVALAACSGDVDRVEAPVTSVTIPSASPSASAAVDPQADRRRFIDLPVTRSSVVSFEMVAPMEKQRARFTGDALKGIIYLDTSGISWSQGDVSVDLGRLVLERSAKTDPEGDYGPWEEHPKQNQHAKEWLEIGLEAEPGKAELNRHALLKVHVAVDHEIRDTKAIYEANAHVFGTLTIHRHTEPVTIAGTLEVVYSRRAPVVHFRTTAPFQVDLAKFDIVPRDALGVVLEKGLEALGAKVAKTADVSVDVTFAIE